MKQWISPIPKKVHLIWIGTSDPPDYYTKYFSKSFEKHMSEFEIRLWRNEDLNKKNFPLTWKYIQKAKKMHGKQMYDEDGHVLYDKERGGEWTKDVLARSIRAIDWLEEKFGDYDSLVFFRNKNFFFDKILSVEQSKWTLRCNSAKTGSTHDAQAETISDNKK